MPLKEDKDIARLRYAIECHLGWGNGSKWHSSMFTELSDKIFEECQIMISITTLKRFWGVINQDVKPSISTLDTLSRFIGFENWRSFKHAKQIKTGSIFKYNAPMKSIYIGLGVLIVFIVIFLIINERQNSLINDTTIKFSSRPVTDTYPNSVVFDFDIGSRISDSLYIQQYWDATKTISINENQNQATGIYYFPGYFRAKLMIDGESVKEHDLFLKSKQWIGTIEYRPVPKYFIPKSSKQIALSYPENLTNEIRSSTQPLNTIFHYVNDLGDISGDSFLLKADIRNTYNEKWAVCQSAEILVLGTKGAMIIPFSKIGCISNNSLMLSDFYLNGKRHDLSVFSTDLSKFKQIQIQVKEKEVSVLIEGSEVFSTTYQKSMGNLVGLRFKFLGLGEVKSYEIENEKGNTIQLN